MQEHNAISASVFIQFLLFIFFTFHGVIGGMGFAHVKPAAGIVAAGTISESF